ncbi:MAG TPA: radical SAM protein [Methanocorpusculum sp.]|nr:radical SAM protein [Methanocorpusculum sp.]
MISDTIIIDGYVDEPACLGVPPYISPYIRTVAGVLKEFGHTPAYVTIDQLRKDPLRIPELAQASLVVMIAGTTVPGKYLAGTPATLTEIQQLGTVFSSSTAAYLGGPIAFGYSGEGGKKAVMPAAVGWTALLDGDPAAALYSVLSGGEPRGHLSYQEYDRFAACGADIIVQHPFYPYVMLELETAKGCSRSITGGCAFCTEPFYGMPRHRELSGIFAETAALYQAGARHFRLGRQPDLLTYGVSGAEFPKPDPEKLQKLFAGIRTAAPELKTLHIDNVNPGTIAHHEDAAREALQAIVDGHTAGDTAAFGVESVDPAVIKANNLKGSPDDIFRAVEIVNEVGGVRRNGIPELLPGLNFIAGLAGETPETFVLNRAFLQKILDAGLLVRRVNIRQLMPFEGTRAYTDNTLGKHDREFHAFKNDVRETFDTPMLEKVFPLGTVFDDVQVEVSGQISFGRQMGTYPVLVGIPEKIPEGTVLQTSVVAYGQRSMTALPYPIRINHLSIAALKWIPGISAKSATKLVTKMPFRSADEFLKAAPDARALVPYMDFS